MFLHSSKNYDSQLHRACTSIHPFIHPFTGLHTYIHSDILQHYTIDQLLFCSRDFFSFFFFTFSFLFGSDNKNHSLKYIIFLTACVTEQCVLACGRDLIYHSKQREIWYGGYDSYNDHHYLPFPRLLPLPTLVPVCHLPGQHAGLTSSSCLFLADLLISRSEIYIQV